MKYLISISLVLISWSLAAQDIETNAMGFETEVLAPIHENREIHTMNTSVWYRFESKHFGFFDFSAGLTATYAWGSIIQLDAFLNEFTLEGNAFGIGPMCQIEFPLLQSRKMRFKPIFASGLLFYANDFPPGGDNYNFMFRVGFNFSYKLNDSYTFGLCPKFMHVSNGQGLVPENPSYESIGVGLVVLRKI